MFVEQELKSTIRKVRTRGGKVYKEQIGKGSRERDNEGCTVFRVFDWNERQRDFSNVIRPLFDK